MVQIFISYAHADEALRQEFDKHLTSLKHQGLIETWHDRRINAGQEWADAIDGNLRTSEVILLLVSADFIASRYCYEVEMQEAMRRHAAREAIVIPVILRPCDWQALPFGKLQAATKDGRPVNKYPTLDDGFLEVVQSIKTAIGKTSEHSTAKPASVPKQVLPTDTTIATPSAHTAPRTSNLRVKKKFSDHDKDTFRIEAFDYVAAFFENSLTELEKRNSHLKTHFRRRDANSFEAAVYDDGRQAIRCGVWLSSHGYSGDLAYSNSGLANGNSFNESLSIADDGYTLGLKPMGFGSFINDSRDKILTLEGAAEYLWSMFVQPLQER